MSKTKLGLSLVLAAFALACSPSAEEQCTDLLETICERVTFCTEEITDTDAPPGFASECVKQVEKSAGVCSKAVDVSSSYDECMDEIKDSKCENFLTIGSDESVDIAFPAACKGVIQVE